MTNQGSSVAVNSMPPPGQLLTSQLKKSPYDPAQGLRGGLQEVKVGSDLTPFSQGSYPTPETRQTEAEASYLPDVVNFTTPLLSDGDIGPTILGTPVFGLRTDTATYDTTCFTLEKLNRILLESAEVAHTHFFKKIHAAIENPSSSPDYDFAKEYFADIDLKAGNQWDFSQNEKAHSAFIDILKRDGPVSVTNRVHFMPCLKDVEEKLYYYGTYAGGDAIRGPRQRKLPRRKVGIATRGNVKSLSYWPGITENSRVGFAAVEVTLTLAQQLAHNGLKRAIQIRPVLLDGTTYPVGNLYENAASQLEEYTSGLKISLTIQEKSALSLKRNYATMVGGISQYHFTDSEMKTANEREKYLKFIIENPSETRPRNEILKFDEDPIVWRDVAYHSTEESFFNIDLDKFGKKLGQKLQCEVVEGVYYPVGTPEKFYAKTLKKRNFPAIEVWHNLYSEEETAEETGKERSIRIRFVQHGIRRTIEA